jgi:hypothetical protein
VGLSLAMAMSLAVNNGRLLFFNWGEHVDFVVVP